MKNTFLQQEYLHLLFALVTTLWHWSRNVSTLQILLFFNYEKLTNWGIYILENIWIWLCYLSLWKLKTGQPEFEIIMIQNLCSKLLKGLPWTTTPTQTHNHKFNHVCSEGAKNAFQSPPPTPTPQPHPGGVGGLTLKMGLCVPFRCQIWDPSVYRNSLNKGPISIPVLIIW